MSLSAKSAVGIIGTGLPAGPVLAGSAYGVAETFRWRASLQKNPEQAPRFYGVLAIASLLALALNFMKVDPIQPLYWPGILNGVVAVPVMIVTMLFASNRKVMGQFAIPSGLRVVGWIATVLMTLASVGLFATF